VLQCVAVCCSVLQCVAVCCSVLQCVAVCCSVLYRDTWSASPRAAVAAVAMCDVVCCSMLQCVAVCCSVQYRHRIGLAEGGSRCRHNVGFMLPHGVFDFADVSTYVFVMSYVILYYVYNEYIQFHDVHHEYHSRFCWHQHVCVCGTTHYDVHFKYYHIRFINCVLFSIFLKSAFLFSWLYVLLYSLHCN